MIHRNLLTLIFSSLVLTGVLLAVVTSETEAPADEATYVGWQACVECHADYRNDIYPGVEEFSKTMHANIHNRPTPENVIIDSWFANDTTLEFYEFRVRQSPGDTFYIDLSKQGTLDQYFIRMRTTGDRGDSTDWFKVAYNYGGNGWLQRFLLEVDGNYYPAPFQYVLKSYKDTTNISYVVYYLDLARWYSYDSENDAIKFHERGTEKFLKESWDKRCAACHVNGFDVEGIKLNDSTTRWVAEWAGSKGSDSAIKDINIAIGCESCHGPGSNHVAEPENADFHEVISPKLWDINDAGSRYWTDRKLDVCNQCHNRHASTAKLHTYQYDDANNQPYKPRLPLRDFVADTVKDASYWGDGKTSFAHHQTGQDYWRSGHYSGQVFKNGCFDCHTAHNNTEYPYQLDRNWYSLKRGEGCVAFGCHSDMTATKDSAGGVYNLHSQHLNKHSQCVNCHYTKTATITFTGSYEFSDHSDKVIRPTATKDFKNGSPIGMLNTCAASCHRNGYGERNRPDAFDRNASIRYSIGEDEIPMKAPDYMIVDRFFDKWSDSTDLWLADSLWEGFKRLYPAYVLSVREGNVRSSTSAITSLTPNPATEEVTIRYDLQQAENILLEVYDNRGRIVRVIAEGRHEAGSYRDEWELINEANYLVESGIYFVRVTGESFTSTKSVIVRR
ncbi:MAG: T9SS type A sorting domain-containing protein [Ignavibacteriae bacterium]|nr:T9SS type A sorting domain-containing protein [Ignavibacteriota bacterium]MCB9216932.1 T9SS type A sorting domain-containing protein [Ignavibacteria bacterium]